MLFGRTLVSDAVVLRHDWSSPRVKASPARHSALAIGKGLAGVREDRAAAGIGLPTADDDVDIQRVDLDQRGATLGLLRGNECGPGTAEWIEDQVAALGAVLDGIGDQRQGL